MIYRDFSSDPVRFVVELFAWALSISCALTLALTAPNPPLLEIYIGWVVGSSMYAWAAWTRGSFGMLANYLLLVCIDMAGLTRMIVGV